MTRTSSSNVEYVSPFEVYIRARVAISGDRDTRTIRTMGLGGVEGAREDADADHGEGKRKTEGNTPD